MMGDPQNAVSSTVPVSAPLPAPDALVDALLGSPLAILLDIDGTLCDIVPTPEDARVPDETRAVLERLAKLPDVHIALVTGRGVADAFRVAGLNGIYISGNHGIETADTTGAIEVDSAADEAIAAFREAADELLITVSRYPAVRLEDKHYTIGVHYRNLIPIMIPSLRSEMQAFGAREGIRVTEGNHIFDIRPARAADKGVAALRLARRVGADQPGAALLFAGDDVTDEDAFQALREHIPHAITIAVGGRVAQTRAQYAVQTPDDMRRLLEQLEAARRS